MTLQALMPGRGLLLGAMLAGLVAPAGLASELFRQPSIGFDPAPVVRTVPPAGDRTLPPPAVRTVPPSTVPSLNANQCQLAAGTCPLGRLQRSGGRCYCATTGGGTRQGTTRTRPQDARPPVAPP